MQILIADIVVLVIPNMLRRNNVLVDQTVAHVRRTVADAVDLEFARDDKKNVLQVHFIRTQYNWSAYSCVQCAAVSTQKAVRAVPPHQKRSLRRICTM